MTGSGSETSSGMALISARMMRDGIVEGIILCIDSPVLKQPGTDGAHGPLMRGGELLKRPARVEGGEKLAILVLAPRLARLGAHLCLATLEALGALQGACGFVQRPND